MSMPISRALASLPARTTRASSKDSLGARNIRYTSDSEDTLKPAFSMRARVPARMPEFVIDTMRFGRTMKAELLHCSITFPFTKGVNHERKNNETCGHRRNTRDGHDRFYNASEEER